MPLNHILRKCPDEYKLGKSQEKINQLIYMDDIKLFAKIKKKTLIDAVRIYIQDIGMEFGMEKCAMLVIKSGKRHLMDRMALPNQDKIRTLGEKETYKYMRILEADIIKEVEMNEKIKKEYLRRARKLLETKLCSRNLIKEINTWVVALVRYSEPFLKCTRKQLKQMDQITRKLMTMHKALHPRDDIDICIRKGGRKTCQHWSQRWRIEATTRVLHRKTRWRTDYSHQKRYWQHEDQQNDNNQETKIGRKTTLWAF